MRALAQFFPDKEMMKPQGMIRKRGRVNKAYQDRFFVLSLNGSLSYYEVCVCFVVYVSFLYVAFTL